MDLPTRLASLLYADALRMEALNAVRTLDLPDGWIGAGFVRDAVWDQLHGHNPRPPLGDVDVIWFDRAHPDRAMDEELERQLRSRMPALDWSVRNQARMHLRNADTPYRDVADAMMHWPETATAVAVRLTDDDRLEINAPFGLEDAFGLRLKPTPHFAANKRPVFSQRVSEKRWLKRYPRLTLG
jgi:hypothetical protein